MTYVSQNSTSLPWSFVHISAFQHTVLTTKVLQMPKHTKQHRNRIDNVQRGRKLEAAEVEEEEEEEDIEERE